MDRAGQLRQAAQAGSHPSELFRITPPSNSKAPRPVVSTKDSDVMDDVHTSSDEALAAEQDYIEF